MRSEPCRDRFITLLRHGEVEGGARFRGRHDDPLSPDGWRQMRAAIDAERGLGRDGWERVLTSPARRCAEFAAELCPGGIRNGAEIEVVAAFRERDFGDWEGVAAERIPASQLSRFWADPMGYDPPGSEPFADFQARVHGGWQDLLQDQRDSVLLLTHGGVIRLILGLVLGMPSERLLLLEIPHACRVRIRAPCGEGLPSLMGLLPS